MLLNVVPYFLHLAGEEAKAQRGERFIRGHTASQTLAVSHHALLQEGFLESKLPQVPRRDQRSHKNPRPGQRSPPWTLVTLPLGRGGVGGGRGDVQISALNSGSSRLRFSVGWEQPVLMSFLLPLSLPAGPTAATPAGPWRG